MSAPEVIREFRPDGPWADLSNFGPGTVTVWSALEDRLITYKTGEHAFNAAKSLDPRERMWVTAAPTPKEAKRRGRRVALRPGWNGYVRYRAMTMVVEAKFSPGTPSHAVLLATGGAHLIEGNHWHDNHWGDCHCGAPKCADEGQNHLGLILMRHRAALVGAPVPRG